MPAARRPGTADSSLSCIYVRALPRRSSSTALQYKGNGKAHHDVADTAPVLLEHGFALRHNAVVCKLGHQWLRNGGCVASIAAGAVGERVAETQVFWSLCSGQWVWRFQQQLTLNAKKECFSEP